MRNQGAQRTPRQQREPRAKRHADPVVGWLGTVAIFRQPWILRNLICPLHETEEEDDSHGQRRGWMRRRCDGSRRGFQ
jgi:hypothetical protein